jgi:lysophospholipase L1-like esterase
MNAVVRAEAARYGFAYFALGALYEQANVKAPFNAVTLMTAPEPYGPLVSADGVHPSAAGARVLALAAANALNARYRFRIPVGL